MTNLDTDATGVKHTPGPWILDGKRAVYHVHRPNGAIRDICVMADDITEQRLVDARLIAAAPDLLAALKEVRGCPQAAPWLVQIGAWDMLNAAIAKAEGK